MSKYEYKCMTCDHIYWFEHSQSYKNCKKCKDSGELRLKSIRHDDFDADVEMQEIKTEKIIEEREEDEEPEMPEEGWKCSECGASVENMNDVCSRGCFNAMMR
tara:strand:- start:130 stop:438 length:309 start_codon:yes stop_codon:yes gene_type:complete